MRLPALGIARLSLRIGIGTTLSVAFLAVAILAVAANVIAQRSFDPVAPIALPVVRAIAPSSRPELEATPTASLLDASRERFRLALDRFDRENRPDQIRDVGAGGSNPLTPTNKNTGTSRPSCCRQVYATSRIAKPAT
jgi:hypothetical protein